jgi:hypothetical protein
MAHTHEQWMLQHNHVYRDGLEKARWFEVFRANVAFMSHSTPETTSSGSFIDLTNDEFRAAMTKNGLFKRSPIDWGTGRPRAPSLKHNGIAGCCWVFSAVAAT